MYGRADHPRLSPNEPKDKIAIPQYLWRVLLVLDRPGSNVTTNTYAVGFWTENRQFTDAEKKWKPTWERIRDSQGNPIGTELRNYWDTKESVVRTVDWIEKATGYDFFSNLSFDIQEIIENNRKILWVNPNNTGMPAWNGKVPENFTPNPGTISEDEYDIPLEDVREFINRPVDLDPGIETFPESDDPDIENPS